MNTLDFQIISKSAKIPTESRFQCWIDAVLETCELVIRIVDEDEMAQFNQQYRHKQGATNILSFAYEAPPGFDSLLLGDLLLCAPVIETQALQQRKPLNHHWAHITIHGTLHLQGYDHETDADATIMEAKEIAILHALKIKNPYQENNYP